MTGRCSKRELIRAVEDLETEREESEVSLRDLLLGDDDKGDV